MLARSTHIFGMLPAVLNISRNYFSKTNHVRALSDKVLGKALHNIASSLVTNPMVDLYLQICSSGLDCPLYRMNYGILSKVFGATSWIYFVNGPNSMERDFFAVVVWQVGSRDLSVLTLL